MITCTHCGATNPDDARSCRRCGALLGAAGESPPPPPEDLPTEPPGEAPKPPEAPENTAGVAPSPEPEAPLPPTPPQAGEAVLFPREQPGQPGQSGSSRSQPGAFLDPVIISGELAGLPQRRVLPTAPGLDADRARLVRALFQEDPLLSQAAAAPRAAGPSFRVPWIILLLGLALLLPALAGGGATGGVGPVAGDPRAAPAQAAYGAISALPVGATALVYWAYDPATAGELDLAALPVVSHLLERDARSLVVTTLPTGLPTARRLYAQAAAGLQAAGAGRLPAPWANDGAFLTGGATALPLVAQDLDRALGLGADAPSPLLAIVFAAQPEDVQHWLELVQPVNALDVVAVTGAAGDPGLRPYLAGGQLVGLVSGFDGARAYQSLRDTPLDAADQARSDLQSGLQSWGGAVLLLVILLGNLAYYVGRAARG